MFSALCVPFRVADQVAAVYMAASMVGAAAQKDPGRMVLLTVFFACYRLLSSAVMHYLDSRLQSMGFCSKRKYQIRFASRYMQMDYDRIESPEGKDLAQRAKNAMAGTDYRDKPAVERFFTQTSELFSNLLGIFLYAGILAVLNPGILLALLFTTAVTYALQRALVHYDQRDKVRYIPLERKLSYLVKEMLDLGGAKDIRLYHMKDWLKGRFEETLHQRMRLHARRSRLQYVFTVIIQITGTAFSAFVYYYLILQVKSGAVDLPGFLLYFGLITGFGGWLTGLVDLWEELHRTLLLVEDLRIFQELPDRKPEGSSSKTEERGIRLDHVSFAYEEGLPVLREIDLKIQPGERVALVGANGAGKTTLVKLLTGLYPPTSGQSFLDGEPVDPLSIERLHQRMAVVFQDIYLLPATIERNITLESSIDRIRLEKAIREAGLESKIASLPQQEQTILVKSVREGAAELSGGEIQKLALARALYKGGSILILDEPTARLDPIAERAMYQRYRDLTQGKTSIFISHRLSSTRFCDRILFLEDGVIKESGTHEELMDLGGSYARMFETQSRYYQEDGA